MPHIVGYLTPQPGPKELNIRAEETRFYPRPFKPRSGENGMSTQHKLLEVGIVVPSPSCAHVFHVFPSFGIGGVPLRMTRVITHFGGRFHHTVVALDNNFAAATNISDNLAVKLLPSRSPRRGLLRTVAGGALELRRMRPDLLLTYNWGAIEWAMAARLLPRLRHVHPEAGF